jgi:hypothetical protein
MKRILILLSLLVLMMINTSSVSTPDGWWWDNEGEYTPVLMERADLAHSVSYQPGSRALVNPGKIYLQQPYIFINERYKGVHVINNTDPSHPVNEGFILAPGCIDMAVKGNIMYLDNAVDLVAFDLKARVVTKRIPDVFPEPVAPDQAYYYGFNRPEKLVVVGWKKKNVTDKNESR